MVRKTPKRRLGDILLDLEPLIAEMIDDHDLQWGDVLNWLHGHLQIHHPDNNEVYVDDNSNPEFYYGPKRK